MNVLEPRQVRACLCALGLALLSLPALAPAASQAGVTATKVQHDGSRDFDWELGTWRTHVKLRLRPLTGSEEWAEFTGTSVVSPVSDGQANIVELDVAGPASRIVGVSLRLYNPQSRQWSLNYASMRSGVLTAPVYGGFKDGRGEFYGQDLLDGRAILVRFVISKLDETAWRFEQAFSADGGQTWELNWIATDTRAEPAR